MSSSINSGFGFSTNCAKLFFRETNSREKKYFFADLRLTLTKKKYFFRGGRFRNLATFFGDISDSALKCEYLEL